MGKRFTKLAAIIITVSLVLASAMPASAADEDGTAADYSDAGAEDILWDQDNSAVGENAPDGPDSGEDREETVIENGEDGQKEENGTGGEGYIDGEAGTNSIDAEDIPDGENDKDDPDDSDGKDDKEDGGEDEPVYGTGLYYVDGIWKYYKDGRFSKATGAAKQADTGEIRYVRNGIFTKSTGAARSLFDSKYYYVRNGVFSASTGVTRSLFNSKLYYMKNGTLSRSTGVAKSLFNDKYYYVKKGILTKSTGVAKSLFNSKWYYMKNGTLSRSTGVAKSLFNSKYYYVRNGIFTESTGVAKSLFNSKWYYMKNGTLSRSTGVAKSLFNKKQYYVKKGIFTQSTGVAKKLSDRKIVFVKKGVRAGSTGVAKSLFNNKFYYVKKGAFNRATGVARILNGSGYRYVKNGVSAAFTGYAELISDGRLIRVHRGKYNGTIRDLTKYTGEYNGLYYQDGYRLTGFRLIGRDCYYYKNGVLTGNTTAKGLTIDAGGKAVGPLNDLILLQSKLIVNSITNDSMSMEEKLWTCFNYAISIRQTRGNPRIPHYRGLDWPYVYANDIFGSRNGGNCFSYAAAFAFLAKACGSQNVFACSDGGHGWTEVDGKLYDPEQYLDGTQVIYGVSIYDGSVSNSWREISLLPDGSYMHVRIPETV